MTDVQRWIARFEAVAAIERDERSASPPNGAWALAVSLPLIDGALAALANAPLLRERRAEEDAAVRRLWARIRARFRA